MVQDRLEFARRQLAANQAVGEAVRRYLFDRPRQINLIDVGQSRATDKPKLVIRAHVEKLIERSELESIGRRSVTDERIQGYEVEVVEGAYRPQRWGGWGGWGGFYRRSDPLVGGVSVGAEYFPAGTLGGIVRDRATQRLMLLSNWHVLVVQWGLRRGQRIYQPARYDGGTDADEIGTLDRDAMNSSLDAAVALFNERRQVSARQSSGRLVTGSGRPAIGMLVEKSGRTTGTTYGRITGMFGVQRLRYGWIERVIRDVVTIEPRNGSIVSSGGDSGSWWIDSDTGAAVGLHFAGSDYPERALALDMEEVLTALKVDIPALL